MADTERPPILQGTLDLLILGTLASGPEHGHGIVLAILERSRDVLLVDHGSLYPARFYSLTRSGRRALEREVGQWRALSAAIDQLIAPAPAGT